MIKSQFPNPSGHWLTGELSKVDRSRWVRYRNSFSIAVAGYVLTIVVLVLTVGDSPSLSKRLLLLIPVAPTIYGSLALKRFVAEGDELAQLVAYQSLAAGFGAMIISTVAVGLVGIPGEATLFNQLAPWLIFVVGMLTWGVTMGVLSARRS